ncbi:hypothetical protein AGMMS50239_33510 [Bacteroidia bacterium]|nr:hypothetical protein AGMMS50239_33510 [Bacteroidia bacterium]
MGIERFVMNLAHITSKFSLDGKEYDVEHFKIAFAQPTNYKGQPEHEVEGGQITIVLTEIPDDKLYDWAKRSTKLKSGEITFETNMSSPVLKVLFTNAYCIKLTREGDDFSGTKTILLLAPEKISMNGVNHTNFWKQD